MDPHLYSLETTGSEANEESIAKFNLRRALLPNQVIESSKPMEEVYIARHPEDNLVLIEKAELNQNLN